MDDVDEAENFRRKKTVRVHTIKEHQKTFEGGQAETKKVGCWSRFVAKCTLLAE
jgi:hypothetical protein